MREGRGRTCDDSLVREHVVAHVAVRHMSHKTLVSVRTPKILGHRMYIGNLSLYSCHRNFFVAFILVVGPEGVDSEYTKQNSALQVLVSMVLFSCTDLVERASSKFAVESVYNVM